MDNWLTAIIAAVAALIALMQWFVARQKLVLDLFDRRFNAYSDVLKAVRPIVGTAAVEHNQMVDLIIAVQNSKFLFGSDVNDYLQEIREAAAQLGYWNTIYNSPNPNAAKAPEEIHKRLLQLTEFFERYPKLCEAYMMMPEKRVKTPLEWIRDRNELRKSYGPEPTKLDA